MMERNRFNRQRVTLLAIGAGASALALIAFSGTCWFPTCWMDEAFVGDLTFWDILGVSAGGFAMILIVRPFRKARRDRADRAPQSDPSASSSTLLASWTPTHSSPSHDTAPSLAARRPADATSIESVPIPRPAGAAVHPTAAHAITDHGRGSSATSRWREMYEQLSDEERHLFRSVVKKFCDGTGRDHDNPRKPATQTLRHSQNHPTRH